MEIKCSGSAQEIYQKLKAKLEEYRSQGKIEQLKEIKFNDSSFQAIASGTGFKSNIQCKDGAVLVDLELNFLLKPMRGKIEESIRKMVSKIA